MYLCACAYFPFENKMQGEINISGSQNVYLISSRDDEKDIGIADFADFSIVVTISDIQGLAICLFRCFLAVPTFDVVLSIRGSVF